ncbi:MAG TPA: type IX secretion system sortase PorU, partial [Chitinophagaceae bacterium]|nr:type IX secretion system sortase PorU [Chitinophagaceae bacterium]
EVWEITNALEPQKINASFNNNQTNFNNDASQLREYVAFNNSNFLTPVAVNKINNQNLHQSTHSDLIIITNPALLSEANRLAAFHAKHDGYAVTVATTGQVYNEFSSGMPDPAALRDFVKMYFDKAGNDSTLRPKYLLLFGAASFDYKNRISNNSNLVPCYESFISVDPLATYTSDDFFGLLNDSDDVNIISPPSLLDIGIGRLPARNLNEAKIMVDKIIRYHSPQGFGPWRNQMVFVADDKDNDLHVQDAEIISADATTTNPLFNQNKIYLDAYKMVSGSGGSRYPDVNAAIVNRVFDGSVLFNYNGHGGYQQLSGSAILTKTELQQFNNPNKLPLFITATCDFAPYDDPTKNSLGIALLDNDSTGAIALMTTTRDVFAASNLVLNDNFAKIALQPDAGGKYLSLGEAVKRTKNYTYQTYGDVYNNRKFVLLGDPAMKLAFPEWKLQLTTINNKNITNNDTLKALNKYVFTGKVTDASGNFRNDFNGTVYVAVFDKPQQVSTLGNDPASVVMPFTTQTNVLYKGISTAKNGLFNFTFIVPKDISYQTGKGRISLYANDSLHDANGVSASFFIGGAGNIISADTSGPIIQPYINDTTFKNGGLTDENPVLLINLFDSSGINTVGTGIGHDITAVIDGDEKNIIVLNNFYSAVANSYQQGQVLYQLPTLTPGKHSIKIKAWDVLDNSGEAVIDFVVMNKNKLQIKNLYNYPNPFSASTTFSFEHNQPGIDLNIVIDIFDLNGKRVDQIKRSINDAGNRIIGIEWNGRNEIGRKMMRGVYIYRIIVSSTNGVATATQKLIAL